MVGNPSIVTRGGGDKSAGFFAHTIRLDNPRVDELRESLSILREWLEVNQHDPEYTSFQLNFMFSGHGDVLPDGSAAVVLADGAVDTDALAELLLTVIPEEEVSPSPCRLDLFLDCCHAAAIARGLVGRLAASPSPSPPHAGGRSRLEPGQVYCACLGDEEALELDSLQHSAFTFAFLNECSRKQPEGAASLNLALRDVGWFTNGEQHPVLLVFTEPGGANLKFPSRYHATRGPAAQRSGASTSSPTSISVHADDPLRGYLEVAARFREQVLDLEKEMATQPELHTPFSRDEILTNQKFPFL